MTDFFSATITLTGAVIVVVPAAEFDRQVLVGGSSSVVFGFTDQVGDPADAFPLDITGGTVSVVLPADEKLYAYGPNASTISLFVGGSPG